MPLPKQHEVDIWNRALGRVGDSKIVPEGDVAVTSVTAANPPVATTATHGYATGDRVLLYDMSGGSQINGRAYLILVLSPTTFSLRREDGTTNAAATGGLCARLPSTKAVKSCFDAWPRVRDEMLRAHPWNSIVRRTRLARLEAATVIAGVTQANPAVVTTTAPHGYTTNDQVRVDGIVGMVELNGRYFQVGNVPTTSSFELLGEDASTYAAWSSVGSVQKALSPLRPDFGYGSRYSMPEDCERILEFTEDANAQWEVEGREVLTDAGITVPIRYCARITDPESWDAQLSNVMSARLASEVVEELTQSKSKRELILAEYDSMISEARREDGQEQAPQVFAEDDWILARL